MSAPKGRRLLPWLGTAELQVAKSATFCCHYGLGLVTADDKWDWARESLIDLIVAITGQGEEGWLKFLSRLNCRLVTSPRGTSGRMCSTEG